MMEDDHERREAPEAIEGRKVFVAGGNGSRQTGNMINTERN